MFGNFQGFIGIICKDIWPFKVNSGLTPLFLKQKSPKTWVPGGMVNHTIEGNILNRLAEIIPLYYITSFNRNLVLHRVKNTRNIPFEIPAL